jgi:hypothetical protein
VGDEVVAWFKRATPEPDPHPPDPVASINVLGRLDTAVDRLEGVAERLLETLERANRQPPRRRGQEGQ